MKYHMAKFVVRETKSATKEASYEVKQSSVDGMNFWDLAYRIRLERHNALTPMRRGNIKKFYICITDDNDEVICEMDNPINKSKLVVSYGTSEEANFLHSAMRHFECVKWNEYHMRNYLTTKYPNRFSNAVRFESTE